MSQKKAHIFVVSNPISSIHASVLMKQFSKENSEFILLIDSGKRKDSFTNEIIYCAGKRWDRIINFGENITDDSNLKPSKRKRLTRKLKHSWPFKYAYNAMLNKYLNRFEKQMVEKMENEFRSIDLLNSDVHLYLLTQTIINSSLIKVFPNARNNYFEHGLPDYLFSLKPYTFKVDSFYCLFNTQFNSFIEKHKLKGPIIKSLMSKSEYLAHCNAVFEKSEALMQIAKKIASNSILVIMQSLEKYELGNEFWVNYLSKIDTHEKEKNGFCNLTLKPHPHQSNEVLNKLSNELLNKGIQHVILNSPMEIGFSSEALFSNLSSKFKAVYSPFSYSVYFLSHLFNDLEMEYYHSYDPMKKHVVNAPKQFQEQFLEHEEIIKECFAIQTKTFNF